MNFTNKIMPDCMNYFKIMKRLSVMSSMNVCLREKDTALECTGLILWYNGSLRDLFKISQDIFLRISSDAKTQLRHHNCYWKLEKFVIV